MTIVPQPLDLVNTLHCTRVSLEAERIGPAPPVPAEQMPEMAALSPQDAALLGTAQVVAGVYGAAFGRLPGVRRDRAWTEARRLRDQYAHPFAVAADSAVRIGRVADRLYDLIEQQFGIATSHAWCREVVMHVMHAMEVTRD